MSHLIFFFHPRLRLRDHACHTTPNNNKPTLESDGKQASPCPLDDGLAGIAVGSGIGIAVGSGIGVAVGSGIGVAAAGTRVGVFDGRTVATGADVIGVAITRGNVAANVGVGDAINKVGLANGVTGVSNRGAGVVVGFGVLVRVAGVDWKTAVG